jgi:transcriptional regulator with XRE-family HTH domain
MGIEKEKVSALFGCHLRAARKDKGLSQEELAARAGIDRTYISSCERGKRNVTLDIIYRLSNALDISSKELIPDNAELDLK